MKHSTDAAKACGIEARRAHTFPIRKTKILKNRLITCYSSTENKNELIKLFLRPNKC
jgi:hypothetical protein